jgi:hypothetical protein
MRTCKECGIEALDEVALDAFVAEKGSKYGRRNLCKSCQYTRNVKYTEENPVKVKEWKTDYQVNKRYGVDRAEYEAAMATSTCCQICETTEHLVYDHDHSTMQFRGVLCRQCNAGLGSLGDTIGGVQKALKYLSS